jgi:predicted ribosome quality control (RQC) complex YloA/Tae2 family protein
MVKSSEQKLKINPNKMFSKIITFVLAGVLALTPVLAAVEQPEMPPTFEEYTVELATAPAQKSIALTPETLAARIKAAEAVQAVLAESIRTDSFAAEVRKTAPAERSKLQKLDDKMQELDRQQSALVQKDLLTTDTAELKNVYVEIKSLRTEVQNLNTVGESATNITSGGTASVFPLPDEESAATDILSESEVDTDLTALEAELAYREELIKRLLKELGENPDTSSSALAANLLAISEYPVASGSIAIFVFVVLWLLRGRIAELSGFGVRVTFAGKNQRNKK